ncbi:MAG: M56 family metallopeptidase [Bacteroidales bacterium]|nr:M56 family metallopeptidase [Bacteroidales bacterium]
MTTLFFKFILSSALLTGLYWIGLRNKASYKACRIFLLMIPAFSILMSTLSFEVYSADTQIINENMLPKISIEKPVPLINSNQGKELSAEAQPIAREVLPAESATATSNIEVADIAKYLGYGVASVSLILVLWALYYVIKIRTIRSRMKSEPTAEGYRMVRSSDIKTPFSFQKTIFMPADLDEGSERLIVSHEKAHIAHRHYVDVLVSEFVTRILWFNPFIWIARNELRNVHEFEADHEVIINGANIKNYQTTLLEMVLNETTPVVSGFNQSFIRRRFIEMRKSTAGTLGKIGKALSALSIAGLFCAFTFTSCKANAPKSTVEGNDTFQPGWFVIHGTADNEISDSAYNIYLGDKYQHLSKEPDTSVVVNNKQWEYKVYLDAPRAGQLAAIFPGGSVCEATIGFIAIPGDTVCINVHNGFYDTKGSTIEHYTNADNAIKAMREATNGETPYLPKIDCAKHWTKVGQRKKNNMNTYQTTQSLMVAEVFFTDTATVLKIMTNTGVANVHFGSDLCLKDTDGKIYKFKHATISDVNDNWGIEERVYGDLIFFEPMPMGTENFSIIRDRDSEVFWINVYDKSNEPEREENFMLTVSGEEMKDWTAILYYGGEGREEMISFEDAKDNKAVIKKSLDENYESVYELIIRNNKKGRSFYITVNANDTVSLNFHDGDWDIEGNTTKIKEINKVKAHYNKAVKEKGLEYARKSSFDYLKSCIEPELNNEAFSAAYDFFVNYEKTIQIQTQEEFQAFLDEVDPNCKIHSKKQ